MSCVLCLLKKKMNSGCYQLIIEIKKSIKLQVGALGIVTFQSGYFVYTGSALKNLKQRVERHFRKEKKIKWHIDYLLDNKNVKIIDVKLHTSNNKEECQHNRKILELPGSWVPIKGFGSSDCRECPAHLIGIGKILIDI
jgi:sugar fermentation stimulation protein A